jgi:hypothetical protein
MGIAQKKYRRRHSNPPLSAIFRLAWSRLTGLSLAQEFAKMSRQKLVNDTAWRRIEDLDSSLVMAENDSVLTDS